MGGAVTVTRLSQRAHADGGRQPCGDVVHVQEHSQATWCIGGGLQQRRQKMARCAGSACVGGDAAAAAAAAAAAVAAAAAAAGSACH